MAKRRKLTAPSPEDLDKMEQEFRSETSRRAGPMAPIAQVAAETADAVEVMGPESRARLAAAEAAEAELNTAKDAGRVIAEIPLEQIVSDALFRDRMVLNKDELDELRDSIRANGLRLPIEVFRLEDDAYGLISGYRRLMVMRELYQEAKDPAFATIKAILRAPGSSADRFAAVVEENEVRASLSHFERGRFAALTVANGVFETLDDAVANLFPFASKAKRSKVRSFALVFEEIGDMLLFGDKLTEKQGLRVANALRAGAESRMREALADVHIGQPADEWAVLDDIARDFEDVERDPARGGRPSKKAGATRRAETSAGIKLSWAPDGAGGYTIHLKGKGLDTQIMESLIAEMTYALGKP